MSRTLILMIVASCLTACSGRDDDAKASGAHPVAEDVLFLVLGKMSLYDQSASGELLLRNHHFVAEIMPKSGREIVGGTLSSASDPSQVFEFASEGTAFLAHGERVMNPNELHVHHPDGEYVFSYTTESGHMSAQPVSLSRRTSTDSMPAAYFVTLHQNGATVNASLVDGSADLRVEWESMAGNTRIGSSDLDDLVFVLAFDCFGNNVAHSGRPYQGGPYLTYRDTNFVIPAGNLNSGLDYTLIVEQATADAEIYAGVPAISTYATLTFVKFRTAGEAAGDDCPAGT